MNQTKLLIVSGIVALIAISGALLFTSQDVLLTQEDKIITTYDQRYITTPDDWNIRSAQSGGIIPKIYFDLPSEIRVGEPFEINIPYTYVGYDDGEVDWVIELPENSNARFFSAWDPDNPGTIFFMDFPQEWDLLNRSDFDDITEHYSPKWERNHYSLSKIIPYDITQEHNIRLIFNMTEPVQYPNEHFLLGVDTVGTSYYINQYGSTFSIDLDRDPPEFAPGAEPQPPCPDCGFASFSEDSDIPHVLGDQTRPDMEQEYSFITNNYDDVLDFGGYETVEDYLHDNFASDWVEEFLTKYPQFNRQSADMNPILNFLLPQAYGQSQYIFVSGTLLMQDTSGRFLAPKTPVTACLVDTDMSNIAKLPTVLQHNSRDVCKIISSDGSFSLYAVNDDPNTSLAGDYVDLRVRFQLENHDLKLVEDRSDTFRYFYTPLNVDHSSLRLSLANIKVSNTDVFSKSYQVYDKVNDGYKHFKKLGFSDIPPVMVQYKPGLTSGVGLSYQGSNGDTTPRISLQDISTKSVKDHPFIILHEFGHHVQHSVYDNQNTSTPTCEGLRHDSNIVTNEKCAWSEGWATFVGLWIENQHRYTSFVLSDVVDFEQATFNKVKFPTTYPDKTEGWITAALLDIVDTTNESGDNMSGESQKLWNAFKNNRSTQSAYDMIAGSIDEFRADWDAEKYPSLQNIFILNNLASASTTPTSQNIFEENFESGLGSWTLTSDDDVNWRTASETLPNTSTSNKVALTSNCDNTCTMTSNIITIPANMELSFLRYVASAIDNNEGLRVDTSYDNGTTWNEIAFYSDNNDKDDSTWHSETMPLGAGEAKLRFVAITSSSSELVKLDNIAIAPVTAVPSGGAVTVFSDNFVNLSQWTKSGEPDWTANPSPWYEKRPVVGTFAGANNCDTECVIISDDIDLSMYSSATLSLDRFVDRSADRGEYLKISLYDGSTWNTVFTWGQDSSTDDDKWHNHSLDISSYTGTSDFKIKVAGLVSSPHEDVGITGIVINATISDAPLDISSGTPTQTSSIVLNETFDNITKWTKSGDDRWNIISTWREEMPDSASSHSFLASNGCRNGCTIQLADDIDMSSFTAATLSMQRYIDTSLDRGEYLKVDIYHNNMWHQVAKWGADNNKDNDTWEAVSIDISDYLNSEFNVRLVAQMSKTNEDVGVDNLKILVS